jgi:hypothetical protein
MMTTGAQKRSAAARSNLLNEAGILERVFSCVLGQWLFFAALRQQRAAHGGTCTLSWLL